MKSQGAMRSIAQLRKKADDVASLLKQLSHPQRLLILCSLVGGEKSVRDIESACESSQSAVSQFLKSMRLEGLIEARREGKQIFYRIADKRILELMGSLYTIFCK